MHRLLPLLGLMFMAPIAFAQTSFVDVTPTTSPYFQTPIDEDFWVNSVAPADYDGDGRVDLAVIGYAVVYDVSVEDKLVLLHNDGESAGGIWSFSATQVPLGDIVASATHLAWGDFDNDGDHDLAVAAGDVTTLFRNDSGSLTRIPATLPGYIEDSSYESSYDLRSLTWADYDNDGDLDLLIPSSETTQAAYRTILMRNDGADGAGGWVFTDASASIDDTRHAQGAWADRDGDGDLDLFLTNVDPYLETGFIKWFMNDAGAFTAADPLGIRVEHGLADIGDADGDGDLDLLVAGNIQDDNGVFSTVLRVYINDAGTYAPTTLIDAPNAEWLDIHAATWADYDSDGDVDLLVTGNTIGVGEIVGKSDIFANDAGTFTSLGLQLPAPIGSVGLGGAFTWFDIDGDGDLDYLVAGAFYVPGGNGLVESRMLLLRNVAGPSNAPPSAPVGLQVASAGQGVALSWTAAADDHTPTAQLTYDLQLWRDGIPLTLPERLPQPGNINTDGHWVLNNLPAGNYEWGVRAVDSAYAGGAMATGTFALPLGTELIFGDDFEA